MLSWVSMLLLTLHVTTFGVITGRALLPNKFNAWSWIAGAGCLGSLILGTEIVLLGYLGLLTKPSLIVSSFIVAAILAYLCKTQSPSLRMLSAEFWRSLSTEARTYKSLSIAVVIGLLFVFACCWLKPVACDEVEYHWAAPLFWAEQTKMVAAPFKMVNGPALLEWLYTWSAVFQSSTCAHFTHALLFIFMLCGAAGLSASIGASPVVAIAACLAVPVIDTQAPIAYNDLGMSAFIIAAYAVLLTKSDEQGGTLLRKFVAVGILLGAAYLSKSLALAAAPVAVAYVLLRDQAIGLRVRFVQSLMIVGPLLLCIICGALHTHHLLHSFSDPTRTPVIGTIPPHPDVTANVYIARAPNDPMLEMGCAAGRIPTAQDLVSLPFTPIITAIIGQHEPYGGRTGLMFLLFLPWILLWVKRTVKIGNGPFWISLAAACYFVLVAPVFIKTRFHIVVWVFLSIFAAAAYMESVKTPKQRFASSLFLLAIAVGLADSAHTMYNFHRGDTARISSSQQMH